MIRSTLGHIQFNVEAENLSFYKELFAFAGWPIIQDNPSVLAAGDEAISLWFIGETNNAKNDYDGPGMNHLALHVKEQGEIDRMVEYLQKKEIPLLFDTPRHRPEFSEDAEHTYYQVMFETPDKILLEVVYIGLLEK